MFLNAACNAHAGACALPPFDGSVDLAAPENWIRLRSWRGHAAQTTDHTLHAQVESDRAGGEPAEAQENHHDVPQRPAVVPEREVEAVQTVEQPALGPIETMHAS